MKMLIKTTMLMLILLQTGLANASIIQATASLDYAQEVTPSNPNPSSATGMAMLTFDTDALTLSLSATIQGIFLQDITFPDGGLSFAGIGPFHIHNAPSGSNGGVVVPFNLEDYFVETMTGLMVQASNVPFDASLIAELAAGNLYLNLHTLDYASGEVRGQLAQVSAPSTLLFLGIAILMLGAQLRKSRHQNDFI